MKNRMKKQAGFTLLEVMVVVVILGVLASFVVPNLLGNKEKADQQKAVTDIIALENALDMYKLDNSVYPTTDQGLEALVTKPSSPEPRNYRDNGYIKRLPNDPWGNEYQYLSPGDNGNIDIFTLGADGQARYQIIINESVSVAQEISTGISEVRAYRKKTEYAYYFNWLLNFPANFQQPFIFSHANMRGHNLSRQQPIHELAANLRCAFSDIVAGNVKGEGVRAVEAHGPFEFHGGADVLAPLDKLLASFVEQHCMKLAGKEYHPCRAGRIGWRGHFDGLYRGRVR